MERKRISHIGFYVVNDSVLTVGGTDLDNNGLSEIEGMEGKDDCSHQDDRA